MYLKLYSQFIKTSFSSLLIFRKNFVVHFFTTIMWTVYYFFSIEIIFMHTDSIAGWTKGEVLFLVATLFLIDGLRVLLFYDNLKNLPSEITDGNLDLVLTKPVDSQFWLSLRRLSFNEISLLIMGVLLGWHAWSLIDIELTITNALIYILLCLCGLIIVYSIWLMLVTVSFWYLRIDNITELFNHIIDIGRYPADLAVITNFPVKALIGQLTIINLIYGLFLTVAFFVSNRLFWLFAVKRYSSASS
jgi:ABC-2 type transport system permease protein